METAIELILQEREKQLDKWSKEHDREHTFEIRLNAALLLLRDTEFTICDGTGDSSFATWGLSERHENRLKRLVIAGALVAAEIEKEIHHLTMRELGS